MSRLLSLLALCAALCAGQEEIPPPPMWRKLQAKMNIEFCSKNVGSELEPCKARPTAPAAACSPRLPQAPTTVNS